MRITYGFIFYLTIATVVLTVLLALLYFKVLRNLIFNLLNKLKVSEYGITKMIFWISLCIIGIVMIDAIGTYYTAQNTLGSTEGFKVDKFQAIKSHEHQSYLKIYNKLKDYYMAERNFMLCGSALLCIFIFNSFWSAFKKLYDIQKQYEGRMKTK